MTTHVLRGVLRFKRYPSRSVMSGERAGQALADRAIMHELKSKMWSCGSFDRGIEELQQAKMEMDDEDDETLLQKMRDRILFQNSLTPSHPNTFAFCRTCRTKCTHLEHPKLKKCLRHCRSPFPIGSHTPPPTRKKINLLQNLTPLERTNVLLFFHKTSQRGSHDFG